MARSSRVGEKLIATTFGSDDKHGGCWIFGWIKTRDMTGIAERSRGDTSDSEGEIRGEAVGFGFTRWMDDGETQRWCVPRSALIYRETRVMRRYTDRIGRKRGWGKGKGSTTFSPLPKPRIPERKQAVEDEVGSWGKVLSVPRASTGIINSSPRCIALIRRWCSRDRGIVL